MTEPDRVVQGMTAYQREKRWLVRELHGCVLEIGAGSGANFGLLSRDVEWIGLEPHRRSRRGLVEGPPGRVVLDAGAERIPLPDASVDAVLSTIVLCSVRDQDRALGEVALFDHGCDPSRETWAALERGSFEELRIRWYASGRRSYIGGYAVA